MGSVNVKIYKQFEQKSSWTIQFIICDQGKGIPDFELDALFEEYSELVGYQRDGSIKKSSGMKLSITKLLVQMLGGEISVDSIEGLGTTFKVSIPLEFKHYEAYLDEDNFPNFHQSEDDISSDSPSMDSPLESHPILKSDGDFIKLKRGGSWKSHILKWEESKSGWSNCILGNARPSTATSFRSKNFSPILRNHEKLNSSFQRSDNEIEESKGMGHSGSSSKDLSPIDANGRLKKMKSSEDVVNADDFNRHLSKDFSTNRSFTNIHTSSHFPISYTVKRKVLLLEHNKVRRGIVSNSFLRSDVKVISVENGNDLFSYLNSLIKTYKDHLVGKGHGQLTEEDDDFFPICPFDFVLINFSSLHQSEEEVDDFQFIKRLNHICKGLI